MNIIIKHMRFMLVLMCYLSSGSFAFSDYQVYEPQACKLKSELGETYQSAPYTSQHDTTCCDNDQYQTCDEPCTNHFWRNAGLVIIGTAAAVGGGILGAEMIGGRRGHHGGDGGDGPDGSIGERGLEGSSGPTGPSGPDSFVSEIGTTLEVSINSIFGTPNPIGSVLVTPFVTDPLGRTFRGPEVVIVGGTTVFPVINIENPIEGTYNMGLSVLNRTEGIIIGITLNGSVITRLPTGESATVITSLSGLSTASGQNQISTTFSLDGVGFP